MLRAIVTTAILFCMISFVQPVYVVPRKTSGCTRAELQAALDSYLAAQMTRDPSRAFHANGKIRYVHTLTPSIPGLDFDAILELPAKQA